MHLCSVRISHPPYGHCRRGAKEADELILELVRIADAVRGDANKHMAHEEQEVLPLLEAHLCAAEQRAMVWRTLRAMPLRLLERVMPWVAGKFPGLCCRCVMQYLVMSIAQEIGKGC